jgi:putative membrane protein
MRAAVLVLAGLALPLPAIPVRAQATGLDDATIVAIFDAANTADIETGRLASERGSTEAIRNFGKMLMNDHTVVRQQGRDLAARLGVTPTPPKDDAATRAHDEAMQKLRGLSGKAFDRAFLQHEVAFHASVIDAVKKTLLPAIQNAELKALVVKVTPAFVGHEQAAEAMLKKQ